MWTPPRKRGFFVAPRKGKMDSQIQIDDIADRLLMFNKITLDRLFQLDNCADCIALYVFYAKTAKWQKTNTVKATDAYIKKSLKWGADKIKRTKETLKEQGLIKVIQRRNNGKFSGWYVEVSFLVPHQNSQNPLVVEAISGEQDTSALKDNNKCLKIKKEMLIRKNERKTTTFDDIFEKCQVEPELRDAILEHIKSRKLNGYKMTDRALELEIAKVRRLEPTLAGQIAVVEQSIENGWRGLFALKSELSEAQILARADALYKAEAEAMAKKRVEAPQQAESAREAEVTESAPKTPQTGSYEVVEHKDYDFEEQRKRVLEKLSAGRQKNRAEHEAWLESKRRR